MMACPVMVVVVVAVTVTLAACLCHLCWCRHTAVLTTRMRRHLDEAVAAADLDHPSDLIQNQVFCLDPLLHLFLRYT